MFTVNITNRLDLWGDTLSFMLSIFHLLLILLLIHILPFYIVSLHNFSELIREENSSNLLFPILVCFLLIWGLHLFKVDVNDIRGLAARRAIGWRTALFPTSARGPHKEDGRVRMPWRGGLGACCPSLASG